MADYMASVLVLVTPLLQVLLPFGAGFGLVVFLQGVLSSDREERP